MKRAERTSQAPQPQQPVAARPSSASSAQRSRQAAAGWALSRAGVRKALKRWRNDPFLLYGVPSLVVLLGVLYLVLSPEPATTSSSTEQPAAPATLYEEAAHRLCSPLAVLDHYELHMRLMRCGAVVLGGEYLSENISIFLKDYAQAAVGLATALRAPPPSQHEPSEHPPPVPAPPTFLVLGFTTGASATLLQSYFHLVGDVVCEDEDILRLAATYFSYTPSRDAYVGSTASFLAQLRYSESSQRCEGGEQWLSAYDAVLLDPFLPSTSAESLSVYTLSSLRAAACLLSSRGLLVVSLPVASKRREAAHSLYVTLAYVFDHVRCFQDGGGTTAGMLTFLASNAPIELQLEPARLGLQDGWEHDDSDAGVERRYAVGAWRKMLADWEWEWDGEVKWELSEAGQRVYEPFLITDDTLSQFLEYQRPVLDKYTAEAGKAFGFH